MNSRTSILFAPATRVVGRLRYAHKFVAVGLVLLVPLGFVVGAYVDLQRTVIAFSAKERQGIEYMAPLVALTAQVVEARHRAVMPQARTELDLADYVASVDAVDRRLGKLLQATGAWQSARRLVVAASSSRDSPRARYRDFNAAADALLAHTVRIGDQSNLTLDPDLDTYYLMDTLQFRLPVVLDTAGRAADRMAIAVADPGIDSTDVFIDVGLDNGVLINTQTVITHAVRTIVASTTDAEVLQMANARLAEFDAAIAALRHELTTVVAARVLTTVISGACDRVRVVATKFAADAATELGRLLQARIDRFSARVRQVEISTGLAALLAIYLFVGFYLSVARPIRRIVAALHAVADGDLDQRVVVDTRDELSFVAKALNNMVAQTKIVTERLAVQATHDTLTLLPNRDVALDRLRHGLSHPQHTGGLMAVLFIDLDRFKLVNDSLGHEAGDDVLCAVATRLRHIVRAGDTVARLAGDEFVVVCEDVDDVGAAVKTGERIVEELSKPIATRLGREVSVGASVGICFADGTQSQTPDEVLRDADMAMYRAKQRGRGRVEIFDDDLREAVEHRLQTQDDLRVGIASGQLRVHYQPIFDSVTVNLTGFEALVRWQHPTRGLLSPAEFIDIAEVTGLIIPLGAAVLAEACRQAAVWRAERRGCERLRIAINVSGVQFDHDSLVPTIASVLAATGLDPDALFLEITETSIMADVDTARDTLMAIRRLGVHLAIDDFGIGYSSLAQLRRFPVEALKIDRSFVSGLGNDPEDDAIVAMILVLAQTLGLQTVAEGVEDASQFASLRRLGCTELQGFYLGRPVPAERVFDASDALAATV